MNSGEFLIFLMFVVTLALVAVVLTSRMTDKMRNGHSRFGGLALLSILAGFLLVAFMDDALVPYDDEQFVRATFALPLETVVKPKPHDKIPACWARRTGHNAEVQFTPSDYATYRTSNDTRSAIEAGVARFFGVPSHSLSLSPQSTMWRKVSVKHSVGGEGAQWPAEHADFLQGKFMCFDIDRHTSNVSMLKLSACDPLDQQDLRGELGRVVAMMHDSDARLIIRAKFVGKAAHCNNRARNFVNNLLGFERIP